MKYKTRTFSLILILCTLTAALNAQDTKSREDHREKFRSMKIAYFTERLELTPEEAEKFWPVYNQFENEKKELKHDHYIRPKKMDQQLEELSDEEVEEIMDNMIDARKREAQLSAEFHEDLKDILPPKKIMKLYITEIQFREHMLRRIRDERGGGGRGGGGNSPPGSKLP
jgi:Spy/CpxP family protein refolding chaperone